MNARAAPRKGDASSEGPGFRVWDFRGSGFGEFHTRAARIWVVAVASSERGRRMTNKW